MSTSLFCYIYHVCDSNEVCTSVMKLVAVDVDFHVRDASTAGASYRRSPPWFGPPAQPSDRLSAQFYKDSSLLPPEAKDVRETGGTSIFQRISSE